MLVCPSNLNVYCSCLSLVDTDVNLVGLCALSTLITLFFLPESNELSLEELDHLFQKAPYVVWWRKYRVDSHYLNDEVEQAGSDRYRSAEKSASEQHDALSS